MRWRQLASSFLLAVTLMIGSAPFAGCEVNPATGQRQLNLLGTEQEVQLGQEAAPQFLEQYGGEIPSQQIQQYVSNLGQRLAAVSERPDLPWEFHVVDSSVINAFALPGGKVFITRGLLSRMENEAQLASVLGHEIGHVTAQHIGQQMSQGMILQTGLEVLGQTTENQWLQILGGVGGNLYLLSFSREQELEADQLGMRYMTRLNYDPRATLGVMEVLAEAGGAGGIEFLQTHPMPNTRIEQVRQIINRQYREVLNNPQYQLQTNEFREAALQPLTQLPPPEHQQDSGG